MYRFCWEENVHKTLEKFSVDYKNPGRPEVIKSASLTTRISATEVRRDIIGIKSYKTSGPNDLFANLLNSEESRETAAVNLTDFFNEIVEAGRAPTNWTISILLSIQNEYDTVNCSNYRSIRLLCHTLIIYKRVIEKSLLEIARLKINNCWSVKGSLHISAARYSLKKNSKQLQSVPEKTFDRISNELIWYALRMHLNYSSKSSSRPKLPMRVASGNGIFRIQTVYN